MKDTGQVLDAGPVATLAWDELFEGARGAPLQPFVPYLDEAGRLGQPRAFHLLGRRDGSGDLFASVWTYAGTGEDDVRRVFARMWSRADLWSGWGRAAVGLGPGYLSGILARDAAGEPPAPTPVTGAVPPACDAADHDEHDVDPDDGKLWCICKDDGYGRNRSYRIFLRDGGHDNGTTFFTLRFDRAGDRDRLWDWMQHNADRYREFEAHFYAHGRDSLKKLIYGGMLETERAVKKMGMGSGGSRPLRFWPGPQESASDA